MPSLGGLSLHPTSVASPVRAQLHQAGSSHLQLRLRASHHVLSFKPRALTRFWSPDGAQAAFKASKDNQVGIPGFSSGCPRDPADDPCFCSETQRGLPHHAGLLLCRARNLISEWSSYRGHRWPRGCRLPSHFAHRPRALQGARLEACRVSRPCAG